MKTIFYITLTIIIVIISFVLWNFMWIRWESVLNLLPINIQVCNESEYRIEKISWWMIETWPLEMWECSQAIKKDIVLSSPVLDVYVANLWTDLDKNVWTSMFYTNPTDPIWVQSYFFWDKKLVIRKLNTQEDWRINMQKIWNIWYSFE